jgi:hypothetical protein
MGSAMETTQQHMTVQRFMRLKTNTLIQREYYHQTILFVMHMLNRAEGLSVASVARTMTTCLLSGYLQEMKNENINLKVFAYKTE